MFKRNEGVIDRILRVTVATVLLPSGLFLFGGLQGNVPGLVVTGLGTIALVTGLTGVCPSYNLFGISTLEKEKELIARCRSMMAGCAAGGASSTRGMCWPAPQSSEVPTDQQV